MFFEGTEKKFELVVDGSFTALRDLGDDLWLRVVRAAGAEVLSRMSNAHCTAYLLSESSLFVFDRKAIMITCGRTTLPGAVREILDVVPRTSLCLFVYERKNEVFPHAQPTSFFDDARELQRMLPGRAWQFGDEDDHHLYLYHLDRPCGGDDEDVTVEILMHGIDEPVRRRFEQADPLRVREATGLATVLPGFEIDDHVFDPAGYSANALHGDEYWTLHVTPDPARSYASFETNSRIEAGDLTPLVHRVLDVFRPRAFDLVTFDRGRSLDCSIEGHRLKTHVEQELTCGYRARFQSFFRPQPGLRSPIELTLGPPTR